MTGLLFLHTNHLKFTSNQIWSTDRLDLQGNALYWLSGLLRWIIFHLDGGIRRDLWYCHFGLCLPVVTPGAARFFTFITIIDWLWTLSMAVTDQPAGLMDIARWVVIEVYRLCLWSNADCSISSLTQDEIPFKLRCASCNKLAVNAFRLPCCDQAICENCTHFASPERP